MVIFTCTCQVTCKCSSARYRYALALANALYALALALARNELTTYYELINQARPLQHFLAWVVVVEISKCRRRRPPYAHASLSGFAFGHAFLYS